MTPPRRRPLLLVVNSSWDLADCRAGLIKALQRDGWPVAAAVPQGVPVVGGHVPTLH